MKRATLIVAALFMLFGGVGPARAGFIVNGSFEGGTLTGWTPTNSGFVSTVGSYQRGIQTTYFAPVDGTSFAVLQGGSVADVYTTLSQTFSADAGQTISGSAFFQANDEFPFNDNGFVEIVQIGAVLFSSDVAALGNYNYGSTPWTSFSYTFTSGGNYTIEAGVETDLSNNQYSSSQYPSVLGLDNIQLSSATATPEPASLTMLGIGLACVASYGWRRRKQSA